MSGLSTKPITTKCRKNDQKPENDAPRFSLQYKNKPLSYLHTRHFDPLCYYYTTNSQDFDVIDALVMGEETAPRSPPPPSPPTNATTKSYNEEMDELICSIVRFDAKYPGKTGDRLPANHPDRLELDRRVAALAAAERLNMEQAHLARYIDHQIQKESEWMESIGMPGAKSVAQINFEQIRDVFFPFGNYNSEPRECPFGSIGEPVRRSEPMISSAMIPSSPKQSPPRYKNGKVKHSMCCSFCYGTHKDLCSAQGVEPLSKDFPGAWSSHPAKENGDVVCPVLFKIRCEICGATGKRAHTTKFHIANPEKCT